MKESQESSSISPLPISKKDLSIAGQANDEGKQLNVNTPTRSEIMAVSTDSRTQIVN